MVKHRINPNSPEVLHMHSQIYPINNSTVLPTMFAGMVSNIYCKVIARTPFYEETPGNSISTYKDIKIVSHKSEISFFKFLCNNMPVSN